MFLGTIKSLLEVPSVGLEPTPASLRERYAASNTLTAV